MKDRDLAMVDYVVSEQAHQRMTRTHFVTTYPIDDPERRTITTISVIGEGDKIGKISIEVTGGISLLALAEQLRSISRIEKEKELGARERMEPCPA